MRVASIWKLSDLVFRNTISFKHTFAFDCLIAVLAVALWLFCRGH